MISYQSLLLSTDTLNTVVGTVTVRAPFMYRVNIGLTGRRFVNVSVLFRRQAYLLGANNVGGISNRTECLSATSANEGLQGTDLLGSTPESCKRKQQMRSEEPQTLASETEEEPDQELFPPNPPKRALGKPFAMLQRTERLRNSGDISEIHQGKRARMEDIGGLRGFTEYFEKDKSSEKKIN